MVRLIKHTFIALFAIIFSTSITNASTLTVTSSNDSGPGSLREAINTAAAGDNIVFGVTTNGVPILLITGEIVINKNLSITGNGAGNTIISGNNSNRIFSLSGTNSVSISNLSLMDGNADIGGAILNTDANLSISAVLISDNFATGNSATEGGGGIANIGGNLSILSSSVISGNIANGTSGSGGGILNLSGGIVSISNSTISSNSASRAGGGIEDNSGGMGMITLIDVNLDNNTTASAPGNGGGLHITGPGNADIIRGTVNGNTASAEGGGLWNGAGVMNVTGTTISGNTASGAAADQGGGGVYNLSGTINIMDATISDNVADGTSGSGGGILNDAGATVSVSNTTISGNSANRAGGGIEDNSGAMGMVTLTDVNLDNNTTASAPGNGGGLHITGPGNADIIRGTVNGNTASAEGGGLWNGAGVMNVTGTTISGNTASGAAADQGGGGVYNLSGTINIMDATISDNVADGTSGSGGGILNDAGANLSVTNTLITGNSSNRAGGGIEDNSGTANVINITDCNIDNNYTGSAPGNGGGIHITGAGNMNIIRGTLNGNVAEREGGGVWNGSGFMIINRVTIDGNTANGASTDDGGGGVFNNGGILNIINSTISNNESTGTLGNGGGIHNHVGGMMEVSYSTLSGNTSANNGAGIANASSMTLLSNTITDNTSATEGGGLYGLSGSTLSLSNTIVAENMAGNNDDIAGDGISSTGFNLIGWDDNAVLSPMASDIVGTSASPIVVGLMPLADNGGLTMTHALDCPSDAIDNGNASDMNNDQIGQVVFGSARDIGAFERQIVCTTSVGNLEQLTGSRVYPNPASTETVLIELPEAFGMSNQVQITDITGAIIRDFEMNDFRDELDIASLSNGTYFIRIRNEKGFQTHKLSIVR